MNRVLHNSWGQVSTFDTSSHDADRGSGLELSVFNKYIPKLVAFLYILYNHKNQIMHYRKKEVKDIKGISKNYLCIVIGFLILSSLNCHFVGNVNAQKKDEAELYTSDAYYNRGNDYYVLGEH